MLFWATWVVAMGSIIYSFYVIRDNEELKKDLINCKMYATCGLRESFKNGTVVGIAYEDYFCVWTKDRKILDTLETCTHEYAHTNFNLND